MEIKDIENVEHSHIEIKEEDIKTEPSKEYVWKCSICGKEIRGNSKKLLTYRVNAHLFKHK